MSPRRSDYAYHGFIRRNFIRPQTSTGLRISIFREVIWTWPLTECSQILTAAEWNGAKVGRWLRVHYVLLSLKFGNYQNIVVRVNNVGLNIKSCRYV